MFLYQCSESAPNGRATEQPDTQHFDRMSCMARKAGHTVNLLVHSLLSGTLLWYSEKSYLCSKEFEYMPKAKSSVEIKNRRASFDYEFIETFQAGIVLTGTEIKSIRAGKASLVDAYCYFNNNELYVKNMHVAEYWWGSWGKHDPRRERKLLLTKRELTRLQRAVKEKGLTIVAVKLYIADNGYAKLLIALARGKKEYDKRASIKEKDLRREMERM